MSVFYTITLSYEEHQYSVSGDYHGGSSGQDRYVNLYNHARKNISNIPDDADAAVILYYIEETK